MWEDWKKWSVSILDDDYIIVRISVVKNNQHVIMVNQSNDVSRVLRHSCILPKSTDRWPSNWIQWAIKGNSISITAVYAWAAWLTWRHSVSNASSGTLIRWHKCVMSQWRHNTRWLIEFKSMRAIIFMTMYQSVPVSVLLPCSLCEWHSF